MYDLYLAHTYFLKHNVARDEKLTCISPSKEGIITYMTRIRGLPLVTDFNEIPDQFDVAAILTKASFQSEWEAQSFMEKEGNAPFVMKEYGLIDRSITGLGKKESKHIEIPSIIIDIIDRRVDAFKTELKMAHHTMKELLFYINGFDRSKLKISNDSSSIMKTCNIVENMLKENGYDIAGDIYNRNPALFCSETEYRMNVETEITRQRLDHDYRVAMDYDE